MIWENKPSLETLKQVSKNTMLEHLGIEFIDIGDDYVSASMPVDHRTVQPFRILHGGASVCLAESLGSIASQAVSPKSKVVGLEVNANHLRSAKEGQTVFATAKPIKLGKRIHVWNIEIKDDQEQLICISRLTVAVMS